MRKLPIHSRDPRQRGMVLLVALILLLLATLLGVSGMRGILLQEKMSANSYDRTLAYQSSEAALRAAERELLSVNDPMSLVGESCVTSTLCNIVPADNATGWRNIPASYQLNQAILPGSAQYFVQLMGEGAPSELPQQLGSANSIQYGGAAGVPLGRSYRITARSFAPAVGGGRAVVYLQTIVRVER